MSNHSALWSPKSKKTDRWTWRQRRFIQWCALPEEGRPADLVTQRQIGEFLGVGPSTLRVWKTYPGFWEEVNREARVCIGDYMPRVLQAMAEEAIAGSVPAMKLYLEYMGVFNGEGAPPIRMNEPIIFIMNEQKLPPPEIRQIAGRDNGGLVEGEFELVELMGAEEK